MKKIFLWALAVLSVISLSAGVARALSYSEISNQPSVLGNSVYNTQTLTSANNVSIRITVTPQYYRYLLDDIVTDKWYYKVNWQRVKNLTGSLYINNEAVATTASQSGEVGFWVKPGVRSKLEFYSKPNKKGTLLVRKYFTSMAVPKSEPVACTTEARLCPDGVNYVSRTGPNCEFAACPTTSKPLCPKGLIYMPECSGVPVQNPDTCEITCPTESVCKNLWWKDNTNTTCSQKQFCGSYMYQGLKTFDSEAACKAELTSPVKIESISPLSAYAGQSVKITGSGFTASGNKVSARINGVDLDFGQYSSTDGKTLSFVVPNAVIGSSIASTTVPVGAYKIAVKNINGGSNLFDFSIVKRFYSVCDYAAPPAGCSYTPGPNYDAQSQCGMVLICQVSTCDRMTNVMPYCANGNAVFNSSTCKYECPSSQDK